jgi:hypothetical protein
MVQVTAVHHEDLVMGAMPNVAQLWCRAALPALNTQSENLQPMPGEFVVVRPCRLHGLPASVHMRKGRCITAV